MTTKLKHQEGGSAPCVVCELPTSCEFLDGEQRWPACPECAAMLHDHPERRAPYLRRVQVPGVN